ncbi:Trans-aconitate 2-methyltransferase [Burkholderiales bacterium 8X]|nr:Trans-aconitate 2-methyltransferase [Burkholderiales bacterium 8X]
MQMLKLEDFLLPGTQLEDAGRYRRAAIKETPAIAANALYFSNPEWAREYLTYCHRSDEFKERWKAAAGDWNDKVVLDVGCGPGNIYATVGGKPRLLIGVDVAGGSLDMAADLGYTCLQADAAHMPFRSGFADIVAVNATIHHCEDMEAVLRESARMVKPGGMLITDHDPQLSAWNYKGPAKVLWDARLVAYRVLGHGFHKNATQQRSGLDTEIHPRPGHGVTHDFFRSTLEPLGFDVEVYPHNHENGAEVLEGVTGKAALKYQIGNLLSGRNPQAPTSALSLMCVARKPLSPHSSPSLHARTFSADPHAGPTLRH